MKSPIWLVGILLVGIIANATASKDKSQANGIELTSTEKWVVQRLTSGEVADLGEHFPNEEDRKLSARFLEELVTAILPGFKARREGIRITAAVVDDQIDLTNARLPSELWLVDCRFNEDVTFRRTRFEENASFSNSTFRSKVSFNSIRVEGSIFFKDVVFEGPVTFVSANIGSQFVATNAVFKDTDQGADFSGIQVGDIAFFSNAVFEGPVALGSATIGRQLAAAEAKFHNKEKTASFNSIKVSGVASFFKAVFEGPVDFAWAQFPTMFTANQAEFRNPAKPVYFGRMKTGAAFFEKTVFSGPVDFGYADFEALDMSWLVPPATAAQVQLQGMTYKYIRGALQNEPESHKALLGLASRAAYSADVYTNLEQFFASQGYRADADRAFIAGKRRERNEYLHGSDWVGSWLLDWLVGYGRHPWQAAIPCAVLVLLGCFLFVEKKMELQKKPDKEDPVRIYNRFWYSLGLFLPFVNLQTAELWKPKTHCVFLRNYVRVHILLGWILIPILLAAISGLIK